MKIEMLNHNSEVLASPRVNVIGGMNGWSARKVVLNVMFARLANDGTDFEEMREHVNDYADAGLRTLILAYCKLDEEEYRDFNEKFSEAINYVSADQESLMDQVAETIEKDLVLGATAVEDKLQCGVPECIDKLAQAGIKIWVLTGDKMETTINIGYACSLLRQGMKQIIINLKTPDIKVLEKSGDKEAIIKVSKDSVLEQINQGKAQLKGSTSSGAGSEAFALIIDGKSLVYALEDDIQNSFIKLAINCASEFITLVGLIVTDLLHFLQEHHLI
ncbi:Putative phospholipid-transporting ATPase 9 [Dionaea muscipula]